MGLWTSEEQIASLPPLIFAEEARSLQSELSRVAAGNAFLLRQVLRQEWGFRGFVVSDWDSVRQLAIHGLTGSDRESAFEAMNAGVDMEMAGDAYASHLEALVRDGRVDESLLELEGGARDREDDVEAQLLAHQLLVVDDQDQRLLGLKRRCLGQRFGLGGREGQVEGRADVDLAAYLDLTLEDLDEARGDGESQAGAAEPARGGRPTRSPDLRRRPRARNDLGDGARADRRPAPGE